MQSMSDGHAIDDAAIPELARHFRFQWEPAQQAHVLLDRKSVV